MSAYLNECWQVTISLAPWLLLGCLLAGVLHVCVPPGLIRRHLGGGRFSAVLKAVALGVPLPLCSCGVIPAGIGLKKEGAGDGAAIGFLISTPQTGVDSIAVSGAILGWPFALFKVAAALVTGLIGGLSADALARPNEPSAVPAASASRQPAGVARRGTEILLFAFGDLLRSIWYWVFLGILVSAALGTFVEPGAVAEKTWANGIPGMLTMLLISTPLYVCATGSVPIAAALVQAGLSPGSALVFLMAGPATNAATVGVIFKTFGWRTMGVYLATIVIGSMMFGLVFDWAFPTSFTSHLEHGHTGTAEWWQLLSGAVLLLLFCAYSVLALRERVQARRSATVLPDVHEPDKPELQLRVTGMVCGNCARKVHGLVCALPGVRSVAVDHSEGTVSVSGPGVRSSDVIHAIRAGGFDVITDEV